MFAARSFFVTIAISVILLPLEDAHALSEAELLRCRDAHTSLAEHMSERLARHAQISGWEKQIVDTATGHASGRRPNLPSRLRHGLAPQVRDTLSFIEARRSEIDAMESAIELARSARNRQSELGLNDHDLEDIARIIDHAQGHIKTSEHALHAGIATDGDGHIDLPGTHSRTTDPDNDSREKIEGYARTYVDMIRRMTDRHGTREKLDEPASTARFSRRYSDAAWDKAAKDFDVLMAENSPEKFRYDFEKEEIVNRRPVYLHHVGERPLTWDEIVTGDYNPHFGSKMVREDQISENFDRIHKETRGLQEVEGPLWKALVDAKNELDTIRHDGEAGRLLMDRRMHEMSLKRAKEHLEKQKLALGKYALSTKSDVHGRWAKDDFDHFQKRVAALKKGYELAEARIADYERLLRADSEFSDPDVSAPHSLEPAIARIRNRDWALRGAAALGGAASGVGASQLIGGNDSATSSASITPQMQSLLRDSLATSGPTWNFPGCRITGTNQTESVGIQWIYDPPKFLARQGWNASLTLGGKEISLNIPVGEWEGDSYRGDATGYYDGEWLSTETRLTRHPETGVVNSMVVLLGQPTRNHETEEKTFHVLRADASGNLTEMKIRTRKDEFQSVETVRSCGGNELPQKLAGIIPPKDWKKMSLTPPTNGHKRFAYHTNEFELVDHYVKVLFKSY